MVFKSYTAWKKGIPFKNFKSLIKLYFFYFLNGFPFSIKKFIKGKSFVYVRGLNMSAFEADMAWNRGIPWKLFKSLIKLYSSCFLFCGFPFYIKNISKWRPLFMIRKICVGHWGIYGLKQGNSLKKIKLLIKLYFSCFLFMDFLSISKVL